MISMKLSRRDFFFLAGGFLVGGAAASATGIAILRYKAYKRQAILIAGDDGWLLTNDERSEISQGDDIVKSHILDVRDQVDIPGGDYKAMTVSNLSECVSACEEDQNCQGFTFARSTHPIEEKRRACWLKSSDMGKPVFNAASYVSGKRGGW